MNYIQKCAALKKIASLKKAAAAVLLVKLATDTAAAEPKADPNAVNYIPGVGTIAGGSGGAALGGLIGGLSSDPEERFRAILLGALGGGTAGAGAGYGYDTNLLGLLAKADAAKKPATGSTASA